MAQKDDTEDLAVPCHSLDLAEKGAEWHLSLHVVMLYTSYRGKSQRSPIIDTLLGFNHPLPSSR